jgi:hypothetical protein
MESAKLLLRGEPAVKVSEPVQNSHKRDLDANPFNRVWRGDKSGSIRMTGVPKFEDKQEERKWIKEHMAGSLRYWGKMGFGEGTAGHITVRDPVLPDHYWMNPFGMHFSLVKVSL